MFNSKYLVAVIVLLASAIPARAALSASTVWELRVGGTDTNGGGFVTGATGTDWSLQNGTQYSVADGVAALTTTITSATANFGTDVVGNIMYVSGGTGVITAGWYQIVTRVNATTVTVDRSTGLTAGTGVTLHIGGALKTLGMAGGVGLVSGNIIYLKSEGSIFSITSASTNVAGGTISSGVVVSFVGYTSTRTVLPVSGSPMVFDAPPTVQLNVASATIHAGNGVRYINIIFDGNTQTAATLTSGAAQWYNCTLMNFNTVSSGNSMFINVLATTNSAAVMTGILVIYCETYGNTATPTAAAILIDNLSYSNTGATTDGAQSNATNTLSFVSGMLAVANGRDGIRSSGNASRLTLNSYAQGNTGTGFNNNAAPIGILFNSGTQGNGTATSFVAPSASFGNIPLSGDAFTNLAGNVYSLNSTAGAGALLRATAMPALFPRGLTPDFADVGAVQSQAATGGSAASGIVGQGIIQ